MDKIHDWFDRNHKKFFIGLAIFAAVITVVAVLQNI